MMICNQSRPTRRARLGFTLVEVSIALVVLATASLLVAEVAMSTVTERSRIDANLAAVEAAANLVEQAHARSWNELTPDWAGAQKLPDSFTSRWPEGRLSIRVEPEPKHSRIKRVTVEIKWAEPNRSGWHPVSLTSLIAARTQEGKS